MDNNFDLNLSRIPKELLLLLEIIKQHTQEKPDVRISSLKDTDWELFIELAKHHRIYPFVYTSLNRISPDAVPATVLQELKQYYKHNTFQMLSLTAEMNRINEVMSETGIPVLFLKGPVLGAELYGDISLRTSGDLDFLVPLHALDKVEALLANLGFIKDDYIQTVLDDWKWRHHHITYFHPERRIKLEIHWRLNPGPGKEPSFNELWSRKRRSTVTGSSIYFLGREDLFLFLVSHGARHGWSRLRWLLDIHQMVNQEMNWAELQKLLRSYNYAHIGGQAIILTSVLFNTTVPKEGQSFLSYKKSRTLAQESIFYLERLVNLHTDPVPEHISKYHQRHLFSLMDLQRKIFYMLSLLHPFPTDAGTLPLPKKLHLLYFPLRPFLWIWRKTRRHAWS
ncbi:nucleotidyltransferase domain-containing protein [Peribacillus kribbensis]|uniref:nucleotidyltransferase domain-containing protein n=1 Tax=Peribacillus kribbensis TaxID=356658 RepID=UPI00040B0773|nr:nucleotidyltransferase family protein [Peribacillus kribbensis]